MFAALEILRPSVLALAAIAVLTGSLVAGYWQPVPMVMAALVAMLIAGGGNVINDIFDYEIDKVNRPKRPLPSGRMPVKNAKIYTVALLVLSIVLALLFLNIWQVALALFNILVAFVYSWRLKKAPLVGNFCPSWLAASGFLFGALFTGIGATVVLLFMMAFFANTGRELAKAIEDVPGDRKAGYRTLPIVFGKNFAAGIAIVFVLFAVLLSPLPWALGLLSTKYLYVVFVADLLFAVACYLLLMNARKGQMIMKIAMFVSIVAFLSGLI